MRRVWLALGSVALISAVIVAVGAPSAIGQSAVTASCTDLTVGGHPSSSAVMKRLSDVPLTVDQKKVIEAAVASLQPGGYVRFGGALIPIAQFLTDNGITPDVIPQIKAAITAATPPTHPPGWPCAPFVNKAHVTAWLRAKLIANGYRPAMTFFNVGSRQIRANAIQDGIEQQVTAAKTGRRTIILLLTSVTPRWGRSYTFTLPFDA